MITALSFMKWTRINQLLIFQMYLICAIDHKIDYANFFYDLAVNRQNGNFSNVVNIGGRPLHLIRIPKASSSALSTVARRIAGCEPYGPCCKYPGNFIIISLFLLQNKIYFRNSSWFMPNARIIFMSYWRTCYWLYWSQLKLPCINKSKYNINIYDSGTKCALNISVFLFGNP